MAGTENVMGISLLAGAAFVEADLGKALVISGEKTVALANAATQTGIGFLGSVPNAAGDPVVVQPYGPIGKVRSGAAITPGQILIAAADGQVTGVADLNALGLNQVGLGVAIETAADGQLFEAMLFVISSAQSA